MKKWILLVMIAVTMGPLYLVMASEHSITLRGIAEETKDGIYVEGVLIREEKLPKGITVSKIVGKKVEVKGVMGHATDETPKSGLQSQRREGEYPILKKVESIKILQ